MTGLGHDLADAVTGGAVVWLADYVTERVRTYARPHLLGIEGLPYSGKTTLAKHLQSDAGYQLAVEHMAQVPTKLVREAWPSGDGAEILARQREFLRAEEVRAARWGSAVVSRGRIVLDRTFVSLIVYLWARLSFDDGFDTQISMRLLERHMERIDTLIATNKLLVPAAWCLLQPPAWVREARRHALSGSDRRDTEAFLLDPAVSLRIESVQQAIFNAPGMAVRTVQVREDVSVTDIARRLDPLVS